MKRRAFTMVELLLASALAVMLLTASLQVVTSLRTDFKATADDLRALDAARVTDWMDWDLRHARMVRQHDGRVTLIGYGTKGHRPAQVEYFVLPGEHGWLVRRETVLTAGGEASSELVCGGARRIELQQETPQSSGTAAPTQWEMDAVPPDRVRLLVTGRGENNPLVDTVVLR